jgi:UDP-N-acetylmuramoyl-L-alanyl-D-glutamate--2,6-diaminopimelate ligase
MRLRALLGPGMTVIGAAGGAAGSETEITGLSADSRAMQPGWLFAALPGSRTDGRRFIADAIARGAAAILGPPDLADAKLAVPVVLDPDPRRRLALIAARFYDRQPRWIAAITGTSGKTSIACFAMQLWTELGHPAACLGTLGLIAPSGRSAPGLTTPDPVRLQALLAELAASGVEHLALEASSHGLDQRRLDGVHLVAAAFTNLSRDHFDYHGSFEAYLAAKRRLFSELLPPGGTAVLNADQPEFAPLAAVCRARAIAVIDYGLAATRLRLIERQSDSDGQVLTFAVDGRQHTIRTPLVGAFQASNLLATLGLALATGADPEAAAGLLGKLRGAPGRMQRIGRHPSGAPVFVDYAHKPDALAQVLDALRPHAEKSLVLVFGCGGDRDPGKRAEMGAIAAGRADRVVVTDDNPRSEDPAAIRRAILDACPGAIEIGDRRAAIRAAIAGLEPGDVLVVAGKGHETGQIVGDRVLPFDDAVEVRAALAALSGAAA